MGSSAKFALLFVLILALLLSVGAQAAGRVNPKDCVVFKIDKCVKGGQYTFFLTEPGASLSSLSGSSLYYIDQLNAGASDADMLIAVILPDFTGCDAYAAGEFSNDAASPRKLGSYVAARTPEQLEEIAESAFEGSAFTHVILGDAVKTIGPRAFAKCSSLTYIYVPNSVTSIDASAFTDSDNVVIGCTSRSVAENFAREQGIPYQTVG